MNSVVVTVPIVFIAGITPTKYSVLYNILYKNQCMRASLATAICDNKQSDCLLSSSQRLFGL